MPSSSAAAIIATPLSLPSLAGRSCPSLSYSPARSHVRLLSTAVIVRLCHQCLPLLSSAAAFFHHLFPPPQPSLTLRSLHHLLLPALVLPHCSPPLNLTCCLCPLLLLSVVHHHHLLPLQPSLQLHCLCSILPQSFIPTSSLRQLSLTILVCHRQLPPPFLFLFCSILSCHLSSTIVTPLVTANVAQLRQSLVATIVTSCDSRHGGHNSAAPTRGSWTKPLNRRGK